MRYYISIILNFLVEYVIFDLGERRFCPPVQEAMGLLAKVPSEEGIDSKGPRRNQ